MSVSCVCVLGVVLGGCLFIPVLQAITTETPDPPKPTTNPRDYTGRPTWDPGAVLTRRPARDPGAVNTRRPTRDQGVVNTRRPTWDPGAVNNRRPTRDPGAVNTRRPTRDPGTVSTQQPKEVPVHSHPDIIKLSSKTDFMMRKLRQLEKDRDSDRDKIKELERHSLENNDDAIRALASSMELQHHVSEIQDRLTQLEENVDNYRLNMNNMRFEQEQIKTELDTYRKLKDSTRRSFRKLDRQFGKYSLRLENLENDIRNVSSNVDIVLEIFQDGMKDNFGKIQSLEQLIENRTKPFFEGNFRHIKSRMNKLEQNMTFPRSSLQLVTNEEGSGDVNTDYILTPIQESSNHIETGSGEETLREIPIGILPHTHSQYLNTEDFILEIQERDEEISDLEKMVDQLKASLSTMETRLTSIQLGDFMGKLQDSLLNFTQNVITLDQWKMASTDIVNSTQFNQRQITALTNMILNNSNHVRDVEWKVADVQSLGYQQFNLLRMYVIQLNNSVQDMKDTMSNLRPSQQQYQQQQQQQLNTNRESPRQPTGNASPPDMEHLDTLKSRVEDLSLQIIYNENRISKLEIHALNESLFECKKYNKDNNQDAKITQINQEVSKLIQTEIMVKEMLKRLDRGLFRVHLANNNQSDVIKDIVREIEHLNSNVNAIDELKQEVDHVRFMLPRDCEEYYKRGHRLSGLYVIHPANASRSLKVSCDMEDESGGWTIIQRRIDGSEEFARGWDDYKAGFGSSDSELWLGNDLIHSLTQNKNLSLKIDMVDMEDKYWTVTYSHFRIGNEESKYKLYVDGYQGNATDSLESSDEMGFSTPDQDNDGSSTNCAMYYTAGWWYKHCHYSNLNGRYQLGMVWYNYDKGEWIQLKRATMKVKAFVL
ncbi:protein scabrous-like [Mizuhopecten yessoensis]|uniref:Fibroleukin n=1 Tax=Mizuhopecten yessoensis TaxID=6573 RepID=A0A210QIJ8_MIZYE|nr:protein scabrous-like [Mizuhopecten yessoensis]OWF48519.1 Fibroleukin [Mizuhopecten yessoensis]